MKKENKLNKLTVKNPIIRCKRLNKDYRLMDFNDNTLVFGNLTNCLVLTDKFGVGIASSQVLDFDNIPDVIILDCKEED